MEWILSRVTYKSINGFAYINNNWQFIFVKSWIFDWNLKSETYQFKIVKKIVEMKLFTRPKRFTDAIAPNIILHRLLGLRVLEYPHGQPRPIFSLIYLLSLYAIHCGSFNLQGDYYTDVTLLKLESALYKIMMGINTCSVFINLLLGWWYTKVSKWNIRTRKKIEFYYCNCSCYCTHLDVTDVIRNFVIITSFFRSFCISAKYVVAAQYRNFAKYICILIFRWNKILLIKRNCLLIQNFNGKIIYYTYFATIT